MSTRRDWKCYVKSVDEKEEVKKLLLCVDWKLVAAVNIKTLNAWIVLICELQKYITYFNEYTNCDFISLKKKQLISEWTAKTE